MEYTIKPAVASDVPRIMEIIEQAKRQMYREGKQQWNEAYPAQEHIVGDIKDGNGYVMCFVGRIIAYGAIIFTGDPAYSSLQGAWLSEQPYVVLHRLAVADEAKRQGVATRFVEEVDRLGKERGIGSFRIDTNYDNVYMQRILEKCGFTHCGEVFFERGSRMAYEKLL